MARRVFSLLLAALCASAIATRPGNEFQVLDRINGIIEKELNILEGGGSGEGTPSLRGDISEDSRFRVAAGAPIRVPDCSSDGAAYTGLFGSDSPPAKRKERWIAANTAAGFNPAAPTPWHPDGSQAQGPDEPGNRVVSLATLENIWKWIQVYAGPEKVIHSMHNQYGKGCANSPRTSCTKDEVCTNSSVVTDSEAGQPKTCSVQREVSIEEVNMHIINSEMVMPLTKNMPAGAPKSFANLVGGGTPTYFISHNWSGSFKYFLATVQAHFKKNHAGGDKKTVYYWVCTFANDQHNMAGGGALDAAVDQGPFAKAIDASKGVLSIQDDAQSEGKLITLHRAWCVFEMVYADKKGKAVVMGFAHRSDAGRTQVESVCDPLTPYSCATGLIDKNGACIDTPDGGKQMTCPFRDILGSFKVADTEASNKDDLAKIVAYIKDSAQYAPGEAGIEAKMKRYAPAGAAQCGNVALTK